MSRSYVTADKVKNAWLGFGDGYQLLMQTFDEYLKDFKEKRVGKDRAPSTLKNYRDVAGQCGISCENMQNYGYVPAPCGQMPDYHLTPRCTLPISFYSVTIPKIRA